MRRARRFLDVLWVATARALITIALGAIVVVAYRDVVGDTIAIEPITVPKDFADAGLSSEVVAGKLRAALIGFQNASTSMHRAQIARIDAASLSQPDIVVPGAGFSVGSLTGWINSRLLTSNLRTKLHMPEQELIVGEITKISHDQFEFCVMLNENQVYRSTALFNAASINDEIALAAIQIVKTMAPYLYAAYKFETAHGDAARSQELWDLLDWIFLKRPDHDENVVLAHNLRGLLLWEEGNYADAAAELMLSTALAERAGMTDFGIAYNNLARLTYSLAVGKAPSDPDRHKSLEAAREFVNETLRRHAYAETYDTLGLIETAEGNERAAKRQFDVAASITPPAPEPFALRALLLEVDGPLQDLSHATSDWRTYLNLSREDLRRRASAEEYAAHAHNLITQAAELHDGGADRAGKLDRGTSDDHPRLFIAVDTPEGVFLPPALAADFVKRPDNQMVLMEACDDVRIAVHLWNTGYAGTRSEDILRSVNDLQQQRRRLDPGAPACVVWPPT